MAARDGNLDVVKLLLGKGAQVNAKTQTGATALMYASFLPENDEVVKMLLDKGADVHIKAKNDVTALLLAGVAGDKKILELLKKAGADSAQKPASSKK